MGLQRTEQPSLLDEHLVELAGRSHTEWFLVFEHGTERHWWTRFLRDGFHHVYALRWDGFNWIRFDPGLGFTDVEILPHPTPDVAGIVSTDCCAILRVTKWRERARYRVPWVLTPWTCVEQCKALLGIRAPHVLTPYQLFRHLRRSQ